MLETLEGAFGWKGKTRACFHLLFGCFFPCVSLASPPQALTQTPPSAAGSLSHVPCWHSPSRCCRFTPPYNCHVALRWCGGELESNQRFLWHTAMWLLSVCPSYRSLRGPVEPLCGGGHVNSHPPHNTLAQWEARPFKIWALLAFWPHPDAHPHAPNWPIVGLNCAPC